MPKYKVLGIFSFADNLNKVKIDDQVILRSEKFNIKSKDAIGVYTLDNKKLGYLPTENKSEITNFNNAYKISALVLNKEYPNVEISRYYPKKNYLENIEYPYEKIIKYDYKLVDISTELEHAVINLQKYLLTKKIKVKRSAVIYSDDNFVNLLLEVSKGIQQFQTVTLKYFKENEDKYEELFENKLIDNTIYRNLMIYRLECYYETNYTNIMAMPSIKDPNILNCLDNVINETIHEPLDILKSKHDIILLVKLYLKYLITKNDFYIVKYLDNIEMRKIIKNYKILNEIIDKFNLTLGNFTYDHKLKIYEYIDFISNDYSFIIADEFKNNYLYQCYLSNTKKIIIYNPINGTIMKMDNVTIMKMDDVTT